jgi:hypothetical protein
MTETLTFLLLFCIGLVIPQFMALILTTLLYWQLVVMNTIDANPTSTKSSAAAASKFRTFSKNLLHATLVLVLLYLPMEIMPCGIFIKDLVAGYATSEWVGISIG